MTIVHLDRGMASTTISFDGEGLRLDSSEDAEVICQKLTGEDVEILILQGNTFGIEAAERVGLELANQPNLREAHFKDLFTSRGREEVPEAMKHLLKGISDSGARLTLLDLSDNAIGPIGAPSVIEFLNSPSCDNLEKLYLNNCGLGPEGSTSIVPSISRLKKLRELIIGRNRLEDLGATNLSLALSELDSLELLKVNQNGIKIDGICRIVDALEANKLFMRDIDLGDNLIKKEGAAALKQFISTSAALKTICLGDSLLKNKGLEIICDALRMSPSLSELEYVSLEGNELNGHKIVDIIKSTFQNVNRDLTLSLLDNEFSIPELQRLESLSNHMEVLLDDIDTDDHGDLDRTEEGQLNDESPDSSNSFEDIGGEDGSEESEMRQISREFIESLHAQPYDEIEVNSNFIQLISMGSRQEYQAVQILCEELGLMKSEQTCKKKPLARDAIVYIGRRLNELPKTFKDFFQVVVRNNDELSCGKYLFDKLEV